MPPVAERAAPVPEAVLVGSARAAAAAAAHHAARTDRDAAFPAAGVAALAQGRLTSAALSRELGGLGADVPALVRVATILARGCGSTAMVWAMHQLQLACVDRHRGASRPLARALADLAGGDGLIASVTSERGVDGNIRSSVAAVVDAAGLLGLDKAATTVSYGRQAAAFLVTARRGADAEPSDQVGVLVSRSDVSLEPLGEWNPMGMRGTDSPGLRLRARFTADRILPDQFADIAAKTMVPLSHLLWSGVWLGLATEAFERARRISRTRRGAPDRRLAEADELLSGIEARLADAVGRYEPTYRAGAYPTVSLSTRLNALKTATSVDAVRVAERCLEVCGMAGYQEDGEFSVARPLRDLYSARLMVANDRLMVANATTLLTVKRS